jgi:hypothetical protein
MDDKSGKPKTPEQLLAEVLAYAKGHHETITANLLRMLGNARAKSQKEEFESYERGLTGLFTELSPEWGAWARGCIQTARALHEATQ